MRSFLLAPLVVLAACSGPEAVPTVGPEAAPSARLVAALADSLAVNRSTTPRRAAIRRALVRSGVTPFGDGAFVSRYQTDLRVPIVGGFIPGRHPLGRSELVVLGTRVDGPAVPAVIEAARVLAERAKWQNVPERSVEVAFWPGGDGIRQVLRGALWPRHSIRSVLAVGGTGPALVDSITVVRIDPAADPAALADSLVERVVALARMPASPTDTLASRSPR